MQCVLEKKSSYHSRKRKPSPIDSGPKTGT